VTVPSWPTASKQCVSGRIRIADGGQYAPPDQAHTVVNVMGVVPVDFDRDGTDEYAVYLMCGEGPEAGGRMVVGYRRTTTGFVPLGRIVGTQDGIEMMDTMRRNGNGIEILVSRYYTDSGQSGVPSQWRTYALSGKHFRQIAGPTSFPANPQPHRLKTAARQVVLRLAGNARTGPLQLTITNSGTIPASALRLRLSLPPSVQPTGSRWTGCVSAAPGSIECPLPDLAAGASLDVTYDLLGPPVLPAPSGPVAYTADVFSVAPELLQSPATASAPIDLLLP
jgi:hypothetical protein